MSGGFSHYCNSQIADIVPASFSTPVQSDIVPAVELTGIDTLKVKPDDFSVVQPFLHGEPDFEDVSLGSSGICALKRIGIKTLEIAEFPFNAVPIENYPRRRGRCDNRPDC